ncbi:MAG: RloB family protein [Saprospiraceae bacterium]|nr:RloB family protein [Saprospiraceae bacterium]
MKNKRAEQTALKKQHIEALKSSKRKRSEPVFEIPAPSKSERATILIVCEGVNTEKSYFEQFRLSSAQIVPVGAGCDTIRVVERAQKEQAKRKCDQVWVVFDKDDFSANDFNNAISMAEGLKYGLAYSNQAFEYWLILHFEDHQGGGMHRDDYDAKLNSYLRQYKLAYDGKGSKLVTTEIFELFLAKDEKSDKLRIDLAIERAKRIFGQYDHASPAIEESSTSVFRLVEEIQKFL